MLPVVLPVVLPGVLPVVLPVVLMVVLPVVLPLLPVVLPWLGLFFCSLLFYIDSQQTHTPSTIVSTQSSQCRSSGHTRATIHMTTSNVDKDTEANNSGIAVEELASGQHLICEGSRSGDPTGSSTLEDLS